MAPAMAPFPPPGLLRFCLAVAGDKYNVHPTRTTAPPQGWQCSEDRQSSSGLGVPGQDTWKKISVCWASCRAVTLLLLTGPGQLLTRLASAAAPRMSLLVLGELWKFSLGWAGTTFISPGQCNIEVLCCPFQCYSHCYFGLWQAAVLGEAACSTLAFARWKMFSAAAKLNIFQSSSRPSRDMAKPQTLVTSWTTDCKTWSADGNI